MLYLLHGPDSFSLKRKVQEIKEQYLKVAKISNLRFFDCKEDSFQDLKEELQTQSLFQDKKLLIVQNCCQEKTFGAELLPYLKQTSHILIFTEEQGKGELFKFLLHHANIQEFPLLKGAALKKWIEKEFLSYVVSPSSQVVQVLMEEKGSDLWSLSSLVRQLASYASDRKSVGLQDLHQFLPLKEETDVFRAVDALAEKKKQAALFLFMRLLASGTVPLYLFSLIQYQFRNLLMVHDLLKKQALPETMLKYTKLHPYVLRKTIGAAQRFVWRDLRNTYERLFVYDNAIKTGRMDAKTALVLLVSSL